LGAANLFADGFAMATGAYLSAKSDREFYQREWHHQLRRIEHAPEQERSRLAALYRAADYSPDEASRLVEIQTRERRRWVNALMITQAGMLPEGTNPLMKGLVTFIAFVVAGTVPLLVHLVGLVMTVPSAAMFPLTVSLSALALFGLGTAKVWITERSAWRSGLEMLAIGGLAATVAYLVGALLGGLTGVSA
jgi:VIT1/CCC1 family predicted Fe2+/Mn2+ transporter